MNRALFREKVEAQASLQAKCAWFIAFAVAAAAMAACAPSSPNLMSPPRPNDPFVEKADVPGDSTVTAKGDILFVVDPSPSMSANGHIERLRKGASDFARGFAQKAGSNADFRIAVVTAWDKGIPANCHPKGKFRPLKGLACGGAGAGGAGGEAFISPATNRCEGSQSSFVEALAETLAVEAEPVSRLQMDASGEPRRGDAGEPLVERLCGPEDEQFFEPALAALDEKLNGKFLRPEAHLSIVLVTDSNSSDEEIEPDEAVLRFRQLKGGRANMVSAYAALSLSRNCATDTQGRARWYEDPNSGAERRNPGALGRFVHIMNGGVNARDLLDLCDPDFGAKLSEIGAAIGERTTFSAERMVKPLRAVPDLSQTRVFCAGREIPRDIEQGWSYDCGPQGCDPKAGRFGRISVRTSVLRAIPNCKQVEIRSVAVAQADLDRGRVSTR